MVTRLFERLSPVVQRNLTALNAGLLFGTIVSAYDVRNTYQNTRKEFGRAFAELQSDFYTPEMDRAQRKLYNLKKRADNEGRNWDDVCGEWAADDLTFALTPPDKLSEEQKIRLKEVEEMEDARRKWSAFFRKFHSLYERGTISSQDVEKHHFPHKAQMKGYLSVVDAMEHASSAIFVGIPERTVARSRSSRVNLFLDKFLDVSLIPTEERHRERRDKYVRMREKVLAKMKPGAQREKENGTSGETRGSEGN